MSSTVAPRFPDRPNCAWFHAAIEARRVVDEGQDVVGQAGSFAIAWRMRRTVSTAIIALRMYLGNEAEQRGVDAHRHLGHTRYGKWC